MKNYIYCAITLFLINSSVWGQAPNWSVTENNYQYTMTFVGFLNSDGNRLANLNDKVAAFVNGECRGVTNLTYVPSENRFYAYLTIYSNVNNETVSFKMYDSVKNVVKNIDKTILFNTNEHYGNLFQSFSFASPPLRAGAEMLDVNFAGIAKKNIVIEGSQITVYLNKGQDITALNTNFSLSPGASIYIGTIEQNLGSQVLNFTSPILFNVLSEDQSVVKQWTVVVKTASETPKYYKKDAVCNAGGAIKVLSTQEGTSVVISSHGMTISTKQIANGEAVFTNLSSDSYIVTIGNEWKLINILLK